VGIGGVGYLYDIFYDVAILHCTVITTDPDPQPARCFSPPSPPPAAPARPCAHERCRAVVAPSEAVRLGLKVGHDAGFHDAMVEDDVLELGEEVPEDDVHSQDLHPRKLAQLQKVRPI